MPATALLAEKQEEQQTGWLDRLSYLGSYEHLMRLKMAVFSAWKIEFEPGNKIAYLDGILGTDGRGPHTGQRHCHFRKWQYYVAAWGRRAGKTFAAAGEVLFVASLPKMRIWVVGPEYETTDRVFELVYNALVIDEILGPGSIKSHAFRKDARYIRLTNGSFIIGKSAESPKSLKGEQLDLLVIDECAFIDEIIFTEYLEPCTLDRLGRVMFISTPRGYNWFQKYYQRGLKKATRLKGWLSLTFKTEDNPFMRLDWLRSKKEQTPKDTYRREYEASFEEFEGRIYPMFRNRPCDLKHPHTGGHVFTRDRTKLPQLTIYQATDIGHRHPTCSLWGGADKKGNVYILREYYGQPSTLHEQHAKAIRALGGQSPVFDSVISHDAKRKYGMGKDEHTERSVMDIYEENGVFTRLASTDVMAGIEIVREYLQASIRTNPNHPRIYIERGCENLIRELEHYIWSETRNKKKDAPETPRKKDDHAVDALRYLLSMNPIWVPANQHHTYEPKKKKDDDWMYGDLFSRARKLDGQRRHNNKGRRARGHGFSIAGMR